MELSVSLYSTHPLITSGEKSVRDIIEFLYHNGVRYVELLDIYMPSEAEKSDAKAALDEYGMKVSSYSVTNEFVTVSDEERDEQVRYLIASCDTAKYFGTDTIRIFAGNMDEEGTKTYEDCVDIIIESLKKCVPHAEKAGVTYCLENHGLLAGKAAQVKHILDAVHSPALKATTDTGNFNLVGENSYESVKMLLNYVGLVHFKDVKRTPDGHWTGLDGNQYNGTIIGKGDVDLPGIVAMLRESGYDGYVSIEYEAQEPDCLAAVAESIRYTAGLL